MDFANFWLSGPTGEDPGPGPGFSIENSLRFRGSGQALASPTGLNWSSNEPVTISFWVKITNPELSGSYIFRSDIGESLSLIHI